MTRTTHDRATQRTARLAATLALAALALGACTPAAPPAARSQTPIYSADFAGKAAVCRAPEAKAPDGRETSVTIVTGGGGWCGITLNRAGKPYAAGLLTEQAHAGRVFVHSVGDDTRIDYTPFAAVVLDSFAVRMLPGDAVLRVTVNPPEGAAPAPAAAASAPAAVPPAAAPSRPTPGAPASTRSNRGSR